jgi:hypothetical protein
VTAATWGRQKDTVCASGLVTPGLTCNADVSALLRARCDGRAKCTVGTSYMSERLNQLAESETYWAKAIDLADPCFQHAYLTGTYQCVSQP